MCFILEFYNLLKDNVEAIGGHLTNNNIISNMCRTFGYSEDLRSQYQKMGVGAFPHFCDSRSPF